MDNNEGESAMDAEVLLQRIEGLLDQKLEEKLEQKLEQKL